MNDRKRLVLPTIGGPTWYTAFDRHPARDEIYRVGEHVYRVVLNVGVVILAKVQSKEVGKRPAARSTIEGCTFSGDTSTGFEIEHDDEVRS